LSINLAEIFPEEIWQLVILHSLAQFFKSW
jgi:hypothetical protein